MFRLPLLVFSILFLMFFSVVGHADEASPSNQADQSSEVADQKPENPDAWRYRWHEGRWWYWLPSEKWVVWSGDRWVPREEVRTAEAGTPRSRRSYSNRQRSDSGYWDLGRWGPVHYDSYGNRQYPYSRRTRGIRQLGVVPAPAGVRALPGWGGER